MPSQHQPGKAIRCTIARVTEADTVIGESLSLLAARGRIG
jgi:hypothetical protein